MGTVLLGLSRFNGVVKHVRIEDYQDCKDANELLQKHGKQAVIDAVEQAVIVENKRIKKLSEVKSRNMSEVPGINTGIAQLDKLLGGFYFGQLIILTGERGLGKSTLGSQFIVNAINQGVTTFCYSGELMDWMFQSWLDRQSAGREYINWTKGPRDEDVYLIDGAALELIHDWYDELCFIYDNSVINSDEDENETILETIETAVKQYGCRMLMIDNLMTAIDDDLSSDLYRQQSAFVRRLAEMAKRYDVIIILIVHPRKRTGRTFDNDEVAGSSNITNLADVVMNYSLPRDDDDLHPDRILQVTKNRLNGNTDYSGIPLWYDIPSKRILEARGLNKREYGWNIPDDFMKLPDFCEEEEIEF